MNPDTLVAVSAYRGDQHQVESNLPCYQHHGCAVLILSPEDAPILQLSGNPLGVYYQQAGNAQWAGPASLVRHRKFLEILLQAPYQNYLLHDADSVCLARELPEYLYRERAAWSNEVPDLNSGTSHLRKIAVQPPYFFHRDVLSAILAKADNPPVSYYGEVTGTPIPTDCIDHYHHQLSAECGFPQRSFPDGASWETTSEVGLREMSRKVREEGAIFIHQVKSSNALHHLLGARSLYEKRR